MGILVCCLDMTENKFYKSPKLLPNDMILNKKYFTATEERYCFYYMNDSKSMHCKIDLFDACPKE